MSETIERRSGCTLALELPEGCTVSEFIEYDGKMYLATDVGTFKVLTNGYAYALEKVEAHEQH